MKLLFVRHGEPDYTIDSLTEKGWKEAELLAERMQRLSDTSQRPVYGNIFLQHWLSEENPF